LLFLRLAYIQIVNYRHFSTLSQENRVKPVPIPPVRGTIFDRNGVVLAQNYPVLTLEVIPDQVEDMGELLKELGKIVTLNERDLKLFARQLRERPRFESLTLRTHLTDEEAARFAVVRHRWNGAELRARLQRHYPQGTLAVHAIGYVGRINEDEMENIDKNAYRGTQHIGKLGIEQSYEDTLLGTVGFEKVETDAHGRAIRVLERIAPVAGRHLHLSLDARMQAIAEQALGNFKGVAIAMDPKTGAVLTFASTPTYDPNPFVNGIDPESYAALRDSKDKPLLNRALNGQYAPGSTIKSFLGLAALDAGENPAKQIVCPGWYSLPGSSHRFRCWKKAGHGTVDLHTAVVQSCDVYFYRLAVTLGIERLNGYLAGHGFGSPTAVDIRGESKGALPKPDGKQRRGQPWQPGETVITGIGQGAVLITPLQLRPPCRHRHCGLAAAAPGAGGRGPDHEGAHPLEQSPNAPSGTYTPEQFEIMVHNLTDVVHGEGGTARHWLERAVQNRWQNRHRAGEGRGPGGKLRGEPHRRTPARSCAVHRFCAGRRSTDRRGGHRRKRRSRRLGGGTHCAQAHGPVPGRQYQSRGQGRRPGRRRCRLMQASLPINNHSDMRAPFHFPCVNTRLPA
jgi:penicillin-binding protein 2